MTGSISVVMLTYNNFEKFARSMSSMFLFISDSRIKEFIILDNGSYQVELKQFLFSLENQVKKIRVVYSDVNLGIASGRKVLYDMAEGDYIASFDSDIVILNPGGFIEVFYKALGIENMMLVGGGGGDHPYFPSMERENIINHDSPENPDQLRFVHEVAGWFHGFKTSILKKHGGFLEMDEQFTPFWGEDSDLCVQIRVNGGKCCIMGKGLVAHQWSSCDKKETQLTLEDQWIKFQNKWYTKFGEPFIFNMDEKFYQDNYPESKKMISKREHYLKIGTIKGNIHSKSVIHHYYPEANFSGNTKIKYLDNIYTVDKFNKKFMNSQEIQDKCLNFKVTSFKENVDDLIILVSKDKTKCFDILKVLVSMQKVNVFVILPEGESYDDLIKFFSKFQVNFSIGSFPEWNFDIIPYVLTIKKLNSLGAKIKRVINLSTERNIEYFTKRRISEISTSSHFKDNLTKIDRMNLSILNQFISLNDNMIWDKECCFIEDYNYLIRLFDSYPFQQLLDRALKIPNKYHNLITPRCSPKDALERLFGYLKPKINDKKILYILVISINNQDDLEKLTNNVKYYTEGDIMIFNSGDINSINLKELGCSYYYITPDEAPLETIWSSAFNQKNSIKLEDYSNFIFSKETFFIESDIKQFIERSKFKDITFMKNKDGFSEYLFSLVYENINIFLTEINKEKYNMQEIFKKLNVVSVWEEKFTEDEEEIVLEYNMVDFDDGSDFPLIIED